jgi:hypothetical protein
LNNAVVSVAVLTCMSFSRSSGVGSVMVKTFYYGISGVLKGVEKVGSFKQ